MRQITFYFLIAMLGFSCTRVQPIQTGEEAIDKKQYDLALDLYQRELKKIDLPQEKGSIYLDMADAALKLGRLSSAEDYAYLASGYLEDGRAEKLLADLLFRNQDYKKAAQKYREAGVLSGNPFEYRREISATRVLLNWDKLYNEFVLETWPGNSQFNEYAITQMNESASVFTSDRPLGANPEKYTQTGNYYHKLFRLKDRDISAFPRPINTENNEGTASFSSDGHFIVFSRCPSDAIANDRHCQLYQAFYKNGHWNLPEKIGFCAPDAHYVHPSLNSEGTLLYFASDAEEGWGGFDIYRSERSDDGSWSAPQLMSRAINTPGHEKFPFVDQDTLFFASDHHTGYGGLDLFRSYRITAGRWSQAMNLRQPINSGHDDFAYSLVNEKSYMSSNRNGNDDIFQIISNPEPRDTSIEAPVLPFPNIYFEVIVRDASERSNQDPQERGQLLSDVNIQLSKRDSLLTPLDESTPKTPVYQLKPGREYSLQVSKEGYFKQEMTVSTSGIQLIRGAADLYLERIVYLNPIEINKEIVLEDIYYDFDKWDIREDAKPSLLRLKKIMQDNPEIDIQLSSHTDCRGTEDYNLELSQKRAQSARQFLISQGIDPERITAVGYGESRLLTDCKCERCTEAEHQLNRRTTFKVVE